MHEDAKKQQKYICPLPLKIYSLDVRKPASVFANNKGADQTVHPHSLISTNVIHLLESIISKHATSNLSIF